MTTDLEKYRKMMPYAIPDGTFDRMKRNIRTETAGRNIKSPRRRGTAIAMATAMAAAIICGIVIVSEHFISKTTPPVPSIETLLTEVPHNVIEQAAANSYDDIIFNQQI